jgi:DivIVA domain-containing protein
VRQTLISTTWLREGYSIDEVDELLDDVAASIDAIADANIVIQPVKTTHKLRRRSPFSRKKRGGR